MSAHHRQSNRISTQIRQRRTTMMNANDLSSLIDNNNEIEEFEHDDDDGLDPQTMDQLLANESNNINLAEELKEDHFEETNEVAEQFQASYNTPPEQENDFSKINLALPILVYPEQHRQRLRTTAGVNHRKGALKSGTNDLDILAQIESEEAKFALEDNYEQDIDDLLNQAEEIHMERIRETSYSKGLAQSVIEPSLQSFGSKNESLIQPDHSGSMINEPIQKKQTVEERTKARFSTSFDDQTLKSNLINTHSIYRKQRKESTQQDENIISQSKEEVKVETEKGGEENDNSLDTEEDLENYLEKLEEEDKKKRFSMAFPNQQLEYQNYDQEEPNGKSISNITKSSGQKDLIDVIEEVDGEDDENFLDNNDSFTKEFYSVMHQDVLFKDLPPKQQRRSQMLQELSQEDWDYKDMIKMIDWNERRYQEIAKKKLKQNSMIAAHQDQQGADIKLKKFSAFQAMNAISAKIMKEKSYSKARVTSLALNEDLLFIGNSEGQVWMFDRESEEDYASFTEKTKEFLGNAVTAIDVHPNRTEYVVLGYERGQMVLFDATDPKKSIKTIKDHHKNAGIVTIKFVDWQGKAPLRAQEQAETDQTKTQQLQDEDKQAWMFISIDQTGRVVINSIAKVLFVLKASKHVVYDPKKSQIQAPLYTGLACRFRSKFHGIGEYDDISMFALSNINEVSIMEARQGSHTEFLKIERPGLFYNQSSNDFDKFQPLTPGITWGYGHSPVLNDRPHSILAVAWGPLIQLIVLVDHEETDNPFITDGYYILRNFDIKDQSIVKQPKIRKSVRFSSLEDEQMYDGQNEEQKDSETIFSKEAKEVIFEEEYDESQAFNRYKMYIEKIEFIADSILMIVTADSEVRLLSTSLFHPEYYDPTIARLVANKSIKSRSKQKKDRQAELEHGLYLPYPSKSEYGGGLYNQTLKFFQQKIVFLTQKNIMYCNHMTWQESIYEFKKLVKDDLVQVFSRALDVYKGKVKGFSGIPDNMNIRDIMLKADLKLIVREIICQVIEKTQQTTNRLTTQTYDEILPVMEETEGVSRRSETQKQEIRSTITKLKEFEDERISKYQTLIRIAIEFCVELKECYFLFYDLFILFQEEQLEGQFIQELEPFIMAGRFQEWEVPNSILQDHVINYYRNDPSKADALEKIIVNLNFAQCPKTIVLEFIHFSEKHFLSTAILFLYTQVIEKKDNTSCIQVLCSLFDLYKKSSKQTQISMIDLQMLKEFNFDSEEKRQIEKSQIYTGYKILWVIRLFIDGKKFPQGNIREKKWRSYIHDVIQFLSTQEFLKVLLDIDAGTLFQVISILFYPSKPFELVQQGREDQGGLKSITHREFLKDLDSYCMDEKTPEHIKYQYLFFVANVVAKSNINGIDSIFYYNIVRELLAKHRRYLEFNKNLHEMSANKRRKLHQKLNFSQDQAKLKQNDEIFYLQKTENDFINLFKLSEPLDNIQINELLKLAEFSKFNQVKVYLLEKKEEYVKCLLMLLSDSSYSEAWSKELQSEKVFIWIKDKLKLLEERSPLSIVDKNIFEQFKREVTQNIKKVVSMNPKETINLIEEKFQANHKEMIDLLSRDPQEQMLYLEVLLEEQDSKIQETIKNYGLMSTNPQEAKKYIDLLKLHLKLCCQLNQTKVYTIVEKMVKNTYYPIQDCLQICQEYGQVEAAFLLNKKLGKYFEAVTLGLEIIKQKVNLTNLKIEIYYAQKKGDISTQFPVTSDHMTECYLFDSIFKKCLKICKKNSKEVERDKEDLIWFIVFDTLQSMKYDNQVVQKKFCKEFFSQRINLFVESMIRMIPFQDFIQHVLVSRPQTELQELSEIITKLFGNIQGEQVVLSNANNAIYKVNTELFALFQQQTRKGVLFRQRVCTICKKYMDEFLYDDHDQSTQDDFQHEYSESDSDDDTPYYYDSQKEPIKLFACRHTFHIRCLNKHYKMKKGDLQAILQKKDDKLRCPICNLKNQDIEVEKGPRGANARVKQQVQQDMEFSSKQKDENPFERKQHQRQMRMTMKSQSLVNKKLQKLTKTMDHFQSLVSSDGLMIKDFKKIV